MKNNWIKVSDKMPENEDYQLVYTSNNDFDFAWYSIHRKAWYWNSFDKVDDCGMNTVTHWQPLEKPNKI